MIEYDLISGVVVRCRRSINTLNKINNLAKITIEDCKIFDDLMTKYSRYLHSQPSEAPVQLPEPDELKQDFNKLASWLEEFNKKLKGNK
jgi:hypothetical protein